MSTNYDDPDLIGAAGFIFQTPVRAKRSKAGKPPGGPVSDFNKVHRSKAMRRLMTAAVRNVAGKKPEVMVKVSGSAKGAKHLREHLAYITRNGKLDAAVSEVGEDSDTSLLVGSKDVRELAKDWYEKSSGAVGSERRQNARETINMVLSMPAGVDRKAVAAAAAAFAKAQFGGRFDYILVNHEDTSHPHAHLTVRARNDQGQYLDPRKADLQLWRERFAAELRKQGIDAAASPRRARGIVQKGTRQAVRHMDSRRAAKTTNWRIQQAVKTLKDQRAGKAPDEPWRKALAERQRKVRSAWGVVAGALEQQGNTMLAAQVREFVSAMPPVATKQDDMIQKIRSNPELLARTEKALQAEQQQAPKRR